MIENVEDFKMSCVKYLNLAWGVLLDNDEMKEVEELIKIIDLVNCDVICETDAGRAFRREIDLNGIINILSVGGQIKKLSEVNFDD